MSMKLYGLPISTCTTTVMTCLHEKQVEFELLPVNLFTAEHKQPPFLSKNPFGQIPVLEDDDLILFESRAISTYIAEKYKSNGTTDLLRHEDLKEAAMVKVWMEVEAHQYNPTIQPIIYQYFVEPMQGNSPNQAIIDENLDKLGKVLDIYEEKLKSTKYLAGDYYTLADLHHLSYTHYFMTTPYATLINSRPNVKAWWEDISSRDAFVKVSKDMKYEEKE
ncbi:Glutathione S-transferase F13 [Bienertia sinuspersici]